MEKLCIFAAFFCIKNVQNTYAVYMNVCKGFNDNVVWTEGEIYECESCGNHVCKECALRWKYVCPNCFGRLWRIS